MIEEEFIDLLMKRFDHVKTGRERHETNWTKLSQHAVPYLPMDFSTETDDLGIQQEKNTEEIMDPTFSSCCTKYASIMETLLTPHERKWHTLEPINQTTYDAMVGDADTLNSNEYKSFTVWLHKLNESLFRMRYSPDSGFKSAMSDAYLDLCVYGNACVSVFEKRDTDDKVVGFKYSCVPLREMYWEENSERKVNTVFRRFSLKPWQIASCGYWDVSELSESTQRAIEERKDESISFLHVVMPKNEGSGEDLGKHFEFEGIFLEAKEKHIIRKGGYRKNPYIAVRFMLAKMDAYGYSHALQALPSSILINAMKKSDLKMREFLSNPTWVGPASIGESLLKRFPMGPGKLIPGGADANGNPLITAIRRGEPNAYGDLVEREKQNIKSVFNIDAFLSEDNKTHRTTTEINERIREKNRLITPVMSRLQEDLLAPLIDRELDIGKYYELFGSEKESPFISLFEDMIEKIEYHSYVSTMQKAEEAVGIARTSEMLAGMYAQSQDARFMVLNPYDTAYTVAIANGVPPHLLASAEDSKKAHQDRQDQQEQLQQAEIGKNLAPLINNVQQQR